MRLFFLLILLMATYGCSKTKTVFICGDHVCVNKTEAKQYFEENLTLEVRILNKENIKSFDLVQLNLKENVGDRREITIKKKAEPSKSVKKLSKSEIKQIKDKIKKRKKSEKITKKFSKKSDFKRQRN